MGRSTLSSQSKQKANEQCTDRWNHVKTRRLCYRSSIWDIRSKGARMEDGRYLFQRIHDPGATSTDDIGVDDIDVTALDGF